MIYRKIYRESQKLETWKTTWRLLTGILMRMKGPSIKINMRKFSVMLTEFCIKYFNRVPVYLWDHKGYNFSDDQKLLKSNEFERIFVLIFDKTKLDKSSTVLVEVASFMDNYVFEVKKSGCLVWFLGLSVTVFQVSVCILPCTSWHSRPLCL